MSKPVPNKIANLIAGQKLVIGDGYRAKNSELSVQGLPFARAGNISGGFDFADADHFPVEALFRVGNKVSEPGDVVFTSKGTVGRVAFVSGNTPPFVYSPQLCFWRSLDHATIDPRFLFYWMQSHEFYVQYRGVASQTDMAEYVSLGDQRRMNITLPAIEEQRTIAHILGTLDDKIELNRQMNQTLDELARTIFRSWFVDFDPVRAKAEGRQPEGMDAETAALFPDRLVDSALGPIPEGWEVRKVQDVADINRSSLRASDQWESLRYVDISSTKEGEVSEAPEYLRGQEPSRARRRLVHGDTVLSTVRPDRRSYFLAVDPPHDLIASTGFAVISPKEVPWSFLHSALTLDSVFQTLGNLADGGAYPAIRPSVIGELPVVFPDDNVILHAYHELVGPLYELAARNRLESRTLAELRDTLLPELLSGRLNSRPQEANA